MVNIFEMFTEAFICSTADGLELFVVLLTWEGGRRSKFQKPYNPLIIIFTCIFIIFSPLLKLLMLQAPPNILKTSPLSEREKELVYLV